MNTLSTAAYSQRPTAVLADVLPGTWARDIALVFAGALLTVLGAQISIPVPPSPVPVTGQTLGVVIAGAALGWKRGAASQLLYVLLGLFLLWRIDNARVEQLRISLVDQFVPSFAWTVKPIAATARMLADLRAYSRVYEQNTELRRE